MKIPTQLTSSHYQPLVPGLNPKVSHWRHESGGAEESAEDCETLTGPLAVSVLHEEIILCCRAWWAGGRVGGWASGRASGRLGGCWSSALKWCYASPRRRLKIVLPAPTSPHQVSPPLQDNHHDSRDDEKHHRVGAHAKTPVAPNEDLLGRGHRAVATADGRPTR